MHDHQEDAFHHRTGGEKAHAGGVALDLETFVTADQRDHEGEYRRLDQAHQQCVDVHGASAQLAHEDRDGDMPRSK